MRRPFLLVGVVGKAKNYRREAEDAVEAKTKAKDLRQRKGGGGREQGQVRREASLEREKLQQAGAVQNGHCCMEEWVEVAGGEYGLRATAGC